MGSRRVATAGCLSHTVIVHPQSWGRSGEIAWQPNPHVPHGRCNLAGGGGAT